MQKIWTDVIAPFFLKVTNQSIKEILDEIFQIDEKIQLSRCLCFIICLSIALVEETEVYTSSESSRMAEVEWLKGE